MIDIKIIILIIILIGIIIWLYSQNNKYINNIDALSNKYTICMNDKLIKNNIINELYNEKNILLSKINTTLPTNQNIINNKHTIPIEINKNQNDYQTSQIINNANNQQPNTCATITEDELLFNNDPNLNFITYSTKNGSINNNILQFNKLLNETELTNNTELIQADPLLIAIIDNTLNGTIDYKSDKIKELSDNDKSNNNKQNGNIDIIDNNNDNKKENKNIDIIDNNNDNKKENKNVNIIDNDDNNKKDEHDKQNRNIDIIDNNDDNNKDEHDKQNGNINIIDNDDDNNKDEHDKQNGNINIIDNDDDNKKDEHDKQNKNIDIINNDDDNKQDEHDKQNGNVNIIDNDDDNKQDEHDKQNESVGIIGNDDDNDIIDIIILNNENNNYFTYKNKLEKQKVPILKKICNNEHIQITINGKLKTKPQLIDDIIKHKNIVNIINNI